MKQTEIAQRLGISKSYLSMILSGQRNTNPELANKLRRYSGDLVHKKVVNSKAKLCLEGRNSTAELLPHILVVFTTNKYRVSVSKSPHPYLHKRGGRVF